MGLPMHGFPAAKMTFGIWPMTRSPTADSMPSSMYIVGGGGRRACPQSSPRMVGHQLSGPGRLQPMAVGIGCASVTDAISR
jgi:hypothetical protein